MTNAELQKILSSHKENANIVIIAGRLFIEQDQRLVLIHSSKDLTVRTSDPSVLTN